MGFMALEVDVINMGVHIKIHNLGGLIKIRVGGVMSFCGDYLTTTNELRFALRGAVTNK